MFAAELRRIRLEAELTQEQLAVLAGLSTRGIQALEAGQARPRRETVERLARALRLSRRARAQFIAIARPLPRRRADRRAMPISASTSDTEPAGRGAVKPLASLAALPTPVSRCIGREREIAHVQSLLKTSRLVMLTGIGGCGKTRLAVEVTAGLRDRFPDGICFVSLASLSDPSYVETTVLHALGLRQAAQQSARVALEIALSHRTVLLVLDTCEHLLEAAPLVAAWLELCPQLTVLATSRAPLGLVGEQVYPVPPLALPDSAADAGDAAAVRLFVERAASVRPGFQVTEANARTVTEICRRLDGLPLAIELAAAWIRTLRPEEIAARLDDRFALLVLGSRAAPARQRTLRDTLDWSHALLAEPEQRLLRRLAVFVGGWTLDAVERVCCGRWEGDLHGASTPSPATVTGAPVASLLDTLSGLVEKSLVVVEEIDSQTRYRLLDTVRQYALQKLQAAGEEPALRDRQRDWLLDFVEQAEPALTGQDQVHWLDRLEGELGNLRAALSWCLDRPDAEAGLRFGAALWRFWEGRNQLGEGRAWLGQVLALDDSTAQPVTVCRALFAAGRMAFLQGDREVASRVLQGCLSRARDLGNDDLVASTLGVLGHLARDRGDLDAARKQYDACRRIWDARHDARGIAVSLLALGRLALMERRIDLALGLLEESLERYRSVGDLTDITRVLLLLGAAACDLGRLDMARVHYVEGLRIAMTLRDRGRIAANLEGCAVLAAAQAQTERAVLLAASAATLTEATGTVLAVDEQRRLEAMISPLREALGAERCDELAAQAREMSVEAAIAYALDDAHEGSGESGRQLLSDPPTSGLTLREQQIVALIGRGLTNQQIADALVVSRRTVEWHVGNLRDKLRCTTRMQLAAWSSGRDPAQALDSPRPA